MIKYRTSWLNFVMWNIQCHKQLFRTLPFVRWAFKIRTVMIHPRNMFDTYQDMNISTYFIFHPLLFQFPYWSFFFLHLLFVTQSWHWIYSRARPESIFSSSLCKERIAKRRKESPSTSTRSQWIGFRFKLNDSIQNQMEWYEILILHHFYQSHKNEKKEKKSPTNPKKKLILFLKKKNILLNVIL